MRVVKEVKKRNYETMFSNRRIHSLLNVGDQNGARLNERLLGQ